MKRPGPLVLLCTWLVGMSLISLTPTLITPPPLPPATPSSRDSDDHQIPATR